MDSKTPDEIKVPDWLHYIALTESGKNEWWRYVLTMALVIWFVFTVALATLAPLILKYGATVGAQQVGEPLWLAVNLAPFPFAILALWLGLRFLHHRPFTSLLGAGRFRWENLALAGGLWLFLSSLGDLGLSIFQPGNYSFSFTLARFLPYAVVVVLLIPLQIGAEELVFRGYLTQGFGRLGGFWLAWLLPTLLFGSLHIANPEVGEYGFWLTMPSYLGIGLLLGWLTLNSGGLELALGVHLANNLYSTLLVTFPSSALPSPALWQIQTLNPLASQVLFFIASLVFVAIILRFRKKFFTIQ